MGPQPCAAPLPLPLVFMGARAPCRIVLPCLAFFHLTLTLTSRNCAPQHQLGLTTFLHRLLTLAIFQRGNAEHCPHRYDNNSFGLLIDRSWYSSAKSGLDCCITMAAAATPPGVVDPTKPAKYPVILSDALLGKSPKEILTAIRCKSSPFDAPRLHSPPPLHPMDGATC